MPVHVPTAPPQEARPRLPPTPIAIERGDHPLLGMPTLYCGRSLRTGRAPLEIKITRKKNKTFTLIKNRLPWAACCRGSYRRRSTRMAVWYKAPSRSEDAPLRIVARSISWGRTASCRGAIVDDICSYALHENRHTTWPRRRYAPSTPPRSRTH